MRDRADWLAWRRKGLGGTDVAAILGEHPQRSEWDVWASKVHAVETPPNDAMQFGTDLEEPIGRWACAEWSKRNGRHFLKAPTRLEAARGPLRGTPDFNLEGVMFTIGLECKTARYPDRGGWTDEGVPRHYEDQVQTYMLLSGANRWLVAVWFLAAYQRRIYVVEADLERQDLIRRTAAEWWQRHIVDGVELDPDASKACADGLRSRHPRQGVGMRVATEDEEALVREFAAVEATLHHCEGRRADLRNRLRAAIADDEGVRFTGGFAKWRRPSNRLTVRIRDHE